MTQIEKVEIIDLTEDFFQTWETALPFTIEHLENYYGKFPEVFEGYFASHCQRTPERLNKAIARYPDNYETMKQAANQLPAIIKDVYLQLSEMLGFNLNLRTRILVGGFGSNAYVTHDGTLHFAVETLTDEPEHLRVLVAHEMAHAYHFAMLKRAGFDFEKMAWDGYTSIYLEGVATVLSEILNPNLSECVYFSFDEKSEACLAFFKKNFVEILTDLNNDLQNWSMDQEVEWFRLRGGKKYGFNRLGYLVGKAFVNDVVKASSLNEAMTLWANHDLKPVFSKWLNDRL